MYNNKNQDIIKYIDSIRENNNSGIKHQFINKIEEVIKYLKNNKIQLEIVKNKIKKVNSVSLFFDFLVELLVFHKHIKENPKFFKRRKE